MDEDTLGIAELARKVVEVGRRHTKQASCTASVGGFVPEAAHAVPVVRPERRRRAAAQGRAAPRRRSARSGVAAAVARPRGDVRRGDREPGRPPHRTGDRAGLARRAARSRSGASTSRLDRWLDAMAAEGLDPDWYVTRHRTEDEILPWDHIAAGLHRDFLWQDWQAALAEHGLPDCRWTPCYDCGVCTDYALEHVVASPVPPAGGSQGTGQDLGSGAREVPVDLVREPVGAGRGACHEGDAGLPGAAAVLEARQGALHLAPRRRPRASSGRSGSRSCRSRSPGLLAPPEGELRAGAVVGHESDAEYLDVELARAGRPRRARRRALSPALPEGIDVTGAAAPGRPGAGAPGGGDAVEYGVDRPGAGDGDGRRRRRPLARSIAAARCARRELPRDPDAARAASRSRTSAPRSGASTVRGPPTGPVLDDRAVDPTPRAPARARCSPRSGPPPARPRGAPGAPRPANGSSATARGWSRWPPTRAARAVEARAS